MMILADTSLSDLLLPSKHRKDDDGLCILSNLLQFDFINFVGEAGQGGKG